MNKQLHRTHFNLGTGDKIALGITLALVCSMCWMFYRIIQLTP
jgi:hypothetical protein